MYQVPEKSQLKRGRYHHGKYYKRYKRLVKLGSSWPPEFLPGNFFYAYPKWSAQSMQLWIMHLTESSRLPTQRHHFDCFLKKIIFINLSQSSSSRKIPNLVNLFYLTIQILAECLLFKVFDESHVTPSI